MDVGKFKASRGRMMAWIVIPPVLIAGVGLSSYGLRMQSEWKLERTRALAAILPQVEDSKLRAEELMMAFNGSDEGAINSEDEFISFLQNAAARVGFTVDALRVERRGVSPSSRVPVLVASVKGTGTLISVQNFMEDVSSSQHLLTENSLKISQTARFVGEGSCAADITFELILFNTGASGGGA